MHIPPLHKYPSWQRFIAGTAVGAIISYGIFTFMFANMYQDLVRVKLELQAQVTDLTNQNKALLQDNEDLDEEKRAPLRVETIEVTISNGPELKIDLLLKHQLEEMLKAEIDFIIGQEIQTLSKSTQLVVSALENKAFTIDDFTHYFDVTQLIVGQQILITVLAKPSNS